MRTPAQHRRRYDRFVDRKIQDERKVRYMKKIYAAPSVEIVKFQYSDQVVAESGCNVSSGHSGWNGTCEEWSQTGGHTN